MMKGALWSNFFFFNSLCASETVKPWVCVCLFHSWLYSRGWSFSCDWGVYLLLQPGFPALPKGVSLSLGGFSPRWGSWRTSQLVCIWKYIKYVPVQSWCMSAAPCVLSRSLQPFDMASLATSDLLLYLNYGALIQRMRWLTGGCSALKFSVPSEFFLSRYLSLNHIMLFWDLRILKLLRPYLAKCFPDQNIVQAYKKTAYCWMHFLTWL